MRINLIILSQDAIALAGLEAIVDQDDRVRLLSRGCSWTSSSIDSLDPDSPPHVVILGEPDSKKVLCEIIGTIANQYRDDQRPPKILVVSQNDDDEVIIAALRAGVNGYLTRIAAPEDLLHSVQIVAAGGAAFSPTVADRFSRYFAAITYLPTKAPGWDDLTPRELEILGLLAASLTNQQMARRLFLAEKTVRNYVSRIFTKLEIHDRTTVTLWAREAGLGDASEVATRAGQP